MNFKQLYIDGAWTDSLSKEWIEVENPATQEIIEKVPRGNAQDVDRAVQAASKAWPSWRKKHPHERIAVLQEVLKEFRKHQNEMLEWEIKELGAPRDWARSAHIEGPIKSFNRFLMIAQDFRYQDKLPYSTLVKEPIGVIACLTPWNYPLGQIVMKIVPALLTGNTVVLKPSQLTPLTALYLADAFDKAGAPAGIFNVVTGAGAQVGDALARHPKVDMVSFTGSTSGGSEVARIALESIKRIALELGGKSPIVLLKGADYREAVKAGLFSIFKNTGQSCSAFSRMLVPRQDQEKILEIIREEAKSYTFGDPQESGKHIGPLSGPKQFEKVKGYLEKAHQEGAKLLLGGSIGSVKPGYFVEPTVFYDVKNDMTIAQEEIFGPVLGVIAYEDAKEALQIANDTVYGLSSAVFGPAEAAMQFAMQLQAGDVYVNNGRWDPNAPFGGYKQSGIGREGGMYGLEEYVQVKSLYHQ